MTGAINNRLHNLLHQDKQRNPQYIKEVIKSDLFFLLNNYFEIEHDDIAIDIKLSTDNIYKIEIKAESDRAKLFNSLPN